jgi:hypothetical protein
MHYTETAAAVAAEVLTLINSKPWTLSQEELVAVIAHRSPARSRQTAPPRTAPTRRTAP